MTSNKLGWGKKEKETLISQSEEQHTAWVSVPEHTRIHTNSQTETSFDITGKN